jgi:serine/threonine-protein kinase
LVALPNFVGQSERDVVERQFTELGIVRRSDPNDPALQARYDPAPPGTVIEQIPAAGQQVPQGGEVAIVVSLGPLPDITGRPFDVAQTVVDDGKPVIQRQNAPSRTVQAGLVISQEPRAGSGLRPGDTLTLTVSQGDVVAFPDVLANGTTVEVARQAIVEAGFNIVAEDAQGQDRLGEQFGRFQPGEVVSATANGEPIDVKGELVPRGADIVLAYRTP